MFVCVGVVTGGVVRGRSACRIRFAVPQGATCEGVQMGPGMWGKWGVPSKGLDTHTP